MMLFKLCALMLVGSVSAGCHAFGDCQSCIGGSLCGWCAVNVSFPTSVGPQCVDLHEQFDCNVQFQTDKCVQGWKCGGSGNSSQCVPSVGGVADKAACEKSCKKPPPPPPKPPSPTPPKKAYKCDNTTLTCKESKFGEPSMQSCQEHCKVSYQCDDASKTCKQADPSAPGKHYTNQSTCASMCPAQPTPVPYEVRGIFRGFAIHNGYVPGEWVANLTATTAAIWYQTATGYSLYMRGDATAIRAPGSASGTYVLMVDSVAGKLKGKIRLLAGDYSQNPEVSGFLSLAVDESSPTTEPADFDTAMQKSAVLALETCPTGGAPTPVPPPPAPPKPPAPPPPCKAKLDVVIILDGSASIISSDWLKALDFTNKLIDGFHVSPDEVEIGIVQFASSARTEVPLTGDKASLKAAVSKISQMRLNTNTYDGFTQAKRLLDNGRSGTKGKLAILMTDGKQNQGLPAKTVSDAMQKEGIVVFGIGVGPSIDEAELKSWCSPPLSDHYFTVAAFSSLEKILQQIIANACPHPPAPPALLRGAANASHPCRFHLPANLPMTDFVEASFALPVPLRAPPSFALLDEAAFAEEDDEAEVDISDVDVTNGTDPCNVFSNCSTCIGSRVGGRTCGWCTAPVSYAGQKTTFQCAGKDAGTSAPKFTCAGHYKTSTCASPGGCGLKGKYRGIRIDNTYTFGEWKAEFTQGGATDEEAKIEQLDGAGKVISTTEGKLSCDAKCDDGNTLKGSNFTLTTTAGQILKGICGWTDQDQAETSGLMWAISNQGVATYPTDFDFAMNTSTAQEFTFYKCADYKGGICTFK